MTLSQKLERLSRTFARLSAQTDGYTGNEAAFLDNLADSTMYTLSLFFGQAADDMDRKQILDCLVGRLVNNNEIERFLMGIDGITTRDVQEEIIKRGLEWWGKFEPPQA